MNRRPLLITGLLAVFLLLPYAQGQSQQVVSVDIPFDFVVNQRVMASGHYQISIDQMLQIMTFSNGKQTTYFFFSRQSVGRSLGSKTELTFVRNGDQRVLHQVLVAKDTHIHDLVHPAFIPEP